MLIMGITPLNYKCSWSQKAFKNNRVSNQSQPTFKARLVSSDRVSEWFFEKCSRLCKLAKEVCSKEIKAVSQL